MWMCVLARKNDKLFSAIEIRGCWSFKFIFAAVWLAFIPIKLIKWSIMAKEKMRSHKAKIYISSRSTMKIFNDVNAYFGSLEWSLN